MGGRHAEIAGAGYAGLVAAAALSQRGWTVRVHERAPELRAFGAGIFIWQNGLRVLKAIGAYDAALKEAHEAPLYWACGSKGEVIGESQFGPEVGSRMITMTRQSLYKAILEAASGPNVEFRLNSQAVAADPSGELMTEDGQRFRGDLVIAADGVASRVRDSLGLLQRRTATGYGAIRLNLARAPGDSPNVILNYPEGERRLLYVPCDPETLYLCFTMKEDDEAGRALPLNRESWTEIFPHFADLFARIGDQGRWDIFETVKVTGWSKGRTALLGDSCHAMTPALGQGAGCAIMNALSLAVALETDIPVPEALMKWEATERPLTEHTQDWAEAVTRSGDLRVTGGGTKWSSEALRTALHVPTGTEHLTVPVERSPAP